MNDASIQVTRSQFNRQRSAEASSLGIPPGSWPRCIIIVDSRRDGRKTARAIQVGSVHQGDGSLSMVKYYASEWAETFHVINH